MPLQSLLEFGITADDLKINLVTIRVIGTFYASKSVEQITQFTEIFPDSIDFIMQNFIRPFTAILHNMKVESALNASGKFEEAVVKMFDKNA